MCLPGKTPSAPSVCAVGVFEKLGAAKDVEDCRNLLWNIEKRTKELVIPSGSDFDGELLETVRLPTSIDSLSSVGGSDGTDGRLNFS